jgi:hypothetical protein
MRKIKEVLRSSALVRSYPVWSGYPMGNPN